LRVSIDESQLKIDKLLGKPTSGDAAALEIAKAKVEADKLAASLNKDLNEYIKLMDAASHGSVMTAIMGTAGAGAQARDVTKGLRDELAKIPKDAQDYGDQVQKALTNSWARAESEINKNAQSAAAERAKSAQSGGIMPGGAPVHDYTKDTQALRDYQTQLSATYDLEDLGKKKDSNDARLKGIEAEGKEFQRTSRIMHQVMEEQKRDAIDAENVQVGVNNLIVSAHEKMLAEMDKNNAGVRKEEDFWLDSGLKAELQAADDKVKAARKAYEEAEKNAKDQEHLYEGLDKMAGEFEKKREETFKQGEDRIAKTFSESFSKTIVQGGNYSKEMTQMGEKMLEEMIQQEMEYIEKKFLFAGVEKLIDATVAAAHAMAIVPFPGNFAAAASVFTATLALAGGGEVPGSGWGDTVPAMLTPGETVVTKQLTDQVKNNVGGGSSPQIHIHMPTVQALDAEGVDHVMKKHSALIQRHVRSELRRQNR
jgi:hypothetical protein